MSEYDEQNIFARILRGELPCHEVWQDDVVLAFMDISPITPGHLLVLPKKASRNLLDADPAALAELLPRVQRVAIAARKAMGSDGVTVQQFNEAAGGQTVFHLHFHVLPRWTDVPLKPSGGTPEDPDVLAEQAARIRDAIG